MTDDRSHKPEANPDESPTGEEIAWYEACGYAPPTGAPSTIRPERGGVDVGRCVYCDGTGIMLSNSEGVIISRAASGGHSIVPILSSSAEDPREQSVYPFLSPEESARWSR